MPVGKPRCCHCPQAIVMPLNPKQEKDLCWCNCQRRSFPVSSQMGPWGLRGKGNPSGERGQNEPDQLKSSPYCSSRQALLFHVNGMAPWIQQNMEIERLRTIKRDCKPLWSEFWGGCTMSEWWWESSWIYWFGIHGDPYTADINLWVCHRYLKQGVWLRLPRVDLAL